MLTFFAPNTVPIIDVYSTSLFLLACDVVKLLSVDQLAERPTPLRVLAVEAGAAVDWLEAGAAVDWLERLALARRLLVLWLANWLVFAVVLRPPP